MPELRQTSDAGLRTDVRCRTAHRQRFKQGTYTMNSEIAEKINILGRFCEMRDLPILSRECLLGKYGLEKADVMVLFGGSILAGADLFAGAIRDGAAEKYVIVGGEGHTTEALRKRIHGEYPEIRTDGLQESEAMQLYLEKAYGLQADLLETRSTNCGNNITNLLALLKEASVPHDSIILCQDATMQRRMDAGLRKYTPAGTKIINFAAYAATVAGGETGLAYTSEIHGMWDMERYITLLMGEIPRLKDDGSGYGPKGKDFIAHVGLPSEVLKAFEDLKDILGDVVREADPAYASSEDLPDSLGLRHK